MKFLVAALLLTCCIGCEKKPTPEEIEKQRAEETVRRSPSPKPGDWMWKNRDNPLEPKKK